MLGSWSLKSSLPTSFRKNHLGLPCAGISENTEHDICFQLPAKQGLIFSGHGANFYFALNMFKVYFIDSFRACLAKWDRSFGRLFLPWEWPSPFWNERKRVICMGNGTEPLYPNKPLSNYPLPSTLVSFHCRHPFSYLDYDTWRFIKHFFSMAFNGCLYCWYCSLKLIFILWIKYHKMFTKCHIRWSWCTRLHIGAPNNHSLRLVPDQT